MNSGVVRMSQKLNKGNSIIHSEFTTVFWPLARFVGPDGQQANAPIPFQGCSGERWKKAFTVLAFTCPIPARRSTSKWSICWSSFAGPSKESLFLLPKIRSQIRLSPTAVRTLKWISDTKKMPGSYVYVGCDCVVKWFDRTRRNKVIVGVTFATDGKCRTIAAVMSKRASITVVSFCLVWGRVGMIDDGHHQSYDAKW